MKAAAEFLSRIPLRRIPGWRATGMWLLLAALALLPVGLLAWYSCAMICRHVHDTAEADNRSTARMAAEVVSRELENSIGVATIFARLPNIVEGVDARDEEAVRERFRIAVESYPSIDRMTVIDTQGYLWSDYPKDLDALGKTYTHRDYYQGLTRNWSPYVSEVYQRVAAPRPWVVAISVPIRNARGAVLGGVVCHYRLETLSNWLEQSTVGERGYVFVTDQRGRIAAHPRLNLQDGKVHDEYAALAPIQEALAGRSSTLEYLDPAVNRTMLATFLPLQITGNYWVVVAQIPVDEAYYPIRSLQRQLALAAGLTFVSALAAVVVLGRMQRHLRRALADAEAASRAKSTFLANMSHEIRTPLNAIIGMTELVLKSSLGTQQREFLATVRDSGEQLLSVINDILDFSKIEAGKLSLERNDFDLRESLGDTMKSFALRAYQQGLELACFIHPDVPRRVIGDYGRLRQVVVNLVGNALKFTERGEVLLEVSLASRDAQSAVFHATVCDTGVGIPPERQTAVFDRFEQADNSLARRYQGAGLGLAIAKRLVELMEGRLWLESESGRGSRFHFTFRLALDGVPPAQERPQPASLQGLRSLIVDDNATNRRILDETVRSWGLQPTSLPSASEALAELRRAQRSNSPYRLVITDAHMPDMDGFELAEQIRRDAAFQGLAIVVLTSGDLAGDQPRGEPARVSCCLLKPVKASELLSAIEQVLGLSGRKGESELAAPAAGTAGRPLKLLLAEDSRVNQTLAMALLRGQGHEVVLAQNGREAVERFAEQPFDLILMDVEMPEVDGLAATRQIRAREQGSGSHIPIVAMTAHALKGDREICLEAGMDGYITKPIRAEELLKTLAEFRPA